MNDRRLDRRCPEGIHGGHPADSREAHNLAQLFIAVEDISRSVSRALEGKVGPPTPLPGGEMMAVLVDPQGIPFGVYHRSGR